MPLIRFVLLSALLTGFIPAALAQAPSYAASPTGAGSTSLSLPTDPRLWRNSPPLSMESLKGKGVVFYFFEEECPRCAANWGNLQTLGKQYEGKPVLFVAVNSGTDPRLLTRYLQQQRVTWPVIHDFDRTLELSMGVPKLNLQGDVFAVRFVAGDGSQGQGKGADFAGAAEAALKGAAWRVDPSAIPPRLHPAWRAIELGDFAAAAKAVTQATEAKDDELKAGGEKLLAAVEEEVKAAAQEATTALGEGDDWKAYKQLLSLSQRFEGYETIELVGRAEEKSKELAKSDGVKDQLAAGKLLEKAIATSSRGGAPAMNRAKGLLERLVKDHPTSEAAERAQTLLAMFGS